MVESGRERVGIFGGTFNPVHFGHLRTAEEVRELLGFRRILFVPSCNPPLKIGGLVAAEYRYEMVRIAIRGNPYFDISDIECRRPGKSYTVETVAELGAIYPGDDLSLILGVDAFLELPAWYQPEKLLASTDFVIVSRPGYRFSDLTSVLDTDRAALDDLDTGRINRCRIGLPGGRTAVLLSVTPVPMSATSIRALAGGGRSIRYLLPDAVESFIISKNLYMEGSEDL